MGKVNNQNKIHTLAGMLFFLGCKFNFLWLYASLFWELVRNLCKQRWVEGTMVGTVYFYGTDKEMLY